MSAYARLRTTLALTFRGARYSNGRAAAVVPLTLMRPEGQRQFLLAESTESRAAKRPLVIVLHGAGASAAQVLGLAFPPSPMSVWLEIAQREQCVVIAPDAGPGGWREHFSSGPLVERKDDVAFIGALIDLAIADHDVDPKRVCVIGVSRGGWMAYRLAMEIPHRLAAFSAVLASMPLPTHAAPPTVPLSALIVGATRDPLMPYRGGKHWYAFGFMHPVCSIKDSARTWRELAGLPDHPIVSASARRHPWDRTAAVRYVWGNDPASLQVALVRIEHGGHAEPSALKRYPYFLNWLVGAQNADIETAEVAWEFFRDKRATQPAATHADGEWRHMHSRP